jgi:hypothetical protein
MKRYSEADKAWLAQEWETSGKSRWAFAREWGFHYQTFRKWTSEPAVGQNFVEAGKKLEEEEAEPGPGTGCALMVEHGMFLVHLPAGSTAQDLAVVVQTLR